MRLRPVLAILALLLLLAPIDLAHAGLGPGYPPLPDRVTLNTFNYCAPQYEVASLYFNPNTSDGDFVNVGYRYDEYFYYSYVNGDFCGWAYDIAS